MRNQGPPQLSICNQFVTGGREHIQICNQCVTRGRQKRMEGRRGGGRDRRGGESLVTHWLRIGYILVTHWLHIGYVFSGLTIDITDLTISPPNM